MQTTHRIIPRVAICTRLSMLNFIARVMLACLLGPCASGIVWADKTTPPRLNLTQADKDWLAAHPVIRMGIDTGYAPYSFSDDKGQLQGLVRDYLDYLGPALGVRFVIISNLDWPQLMAAVQARQIDAVATVAQLPERDAFLEFSSLYIVTPLVIMTRNDTPPLRSLDELAQMNLTLVDGYSSSKEVMQQFPELRPRYVAKPIDGLTAVSSGLADAYVGVLGVSSYLATQRGLSNLKVNAAFDMEVNGQRFGVRNDWPQLAHLLDQALLAMPIKRKNAILQTWLPVHAQEIRRLSQPAPLTRALPWLIALMATAILAYLLTALWNRQLKRELIKRQHELLESRNLLQAAETISHVGNWQYTVANGEIKWSDEVYRIFGVAPQSQPITYDWLLGCVHPDDRASHNAYLERMVNSRPGDNMPELRCRLILRNGEIRTASVRVRVEFDASGQPHTLFGTLQNVTEQVRTEESIAALNRLYRVLSGINIAIVRMRDPQALFDEACRIAVEVGEFRMAWLGMLDADSHEVKPLARAGVVDDYLDKIHISLGEDAHGQGPTGTALRAGQHAICHDIATDPNMAPWRAAALELGYRSSAAFPILVNGEVRGVFNLYADRVDFLDEDELRLLDELAKDIGFALEFIETNYAKESLNVRMLDLLGSMREGFFSLDRNMRFLYVNHSAEKMLSRTLNDLMGKHVWTEFPEAIDSPFQKGIERAMDEAESTHVEAYYPPWDRWFQSHIYPTRDGVSFFFTDVTERIHQEKETQRLHSVLNALVKGSTDAIFVKDTEGIYLIGNQGLSNLLEQPIESIVGVDDYALFPKEYAQRFRADDQRIMSERVTQTYEEEVSTETANYHYLTTKGALVIEGEVRGVFGIARDITNSKQVETALMESESRLRLFIEHAPAALAMFDLDMRYMAVSRRWMTDYQLERSDIIGESHYDVFSDRPEHWKPIHQRGMAGELVRNKRDRFERADGSTQWLSWEIRPWFASDSSVGGIVIFSEDITERILAEESLRSSEGRFAATFEQAAVGIAIVSPEGRWIRVNRKLCDIVGYSEAELLGLTFQDITHPNDLNTDLGYVRQMLAHEIDTYKLEKRYLHKDGSPVWINLTVSLIWKNDEDPDYFISVIEDISARKAVEAALSESEAHYRQLFEQNPMPMLVYERGSMHMLAVNEAFVRHYGYSHQEISAMRLTDLYPEEEKQPITDVAALLHGLAYVGEWHHLKKNGSQILIEVRSHDLAFEGHSARVAVITDITERKQMDHRLREQLDELTRWQTIILGREDRIQALKVEVNDLLSGQGHSVRYPSQANPS